MCNIVLGLKMIKNTLIFLAELSWELGLIGIDEFEERIDVAFWLSDEGHKRQDPRQSDTEEATLKDDFNSPLSGDDDRLIASKRPQENEEDFLAFIAWKTWYFTGSDPDSYPSVPHGHYQSATNRWPKLNPYTGRVFSQKNKEDNSKRLSKNEMQQLWRDFDFRNFCRAHILWYMQKHGQYRFPVRNPLKLPRW